MERNNNNLSNNNMKDHSLLGGKSNRENYNNYYYNNNNNNKAIKSPWEYSSSSSNPSFADDYMGNGFSWPPRSYICSFCKREFRSAQALGGHMNVHRRDRARLRVQQHESPPARDINLNLNPNPNPNFLTTPPPPSTRLHHPSYTSTTTCTLLPSLVSPSLSSSSSASASHHHEIKKSAAADGALRLRNLSPKGSDLIRTTKAVKSLFGGVKEFHGNFTQARERDVLMKKKKKADFVGLELGIGLHSDLKEDVDLELRLGYS